MGACRRTNRWNNNGDVGREGDALQGKVLCRRVGACYNEPTFAGGPTVKMRAISTVLGVIGVGFLLLAVALRLWGTRPWVFTLREDVDTSSGDIRRRIRILGVQVRDRTEESPFSREVRKLHIRTPETRVWEHVGSGTLGGYTSYPYGLALTDCNFLVQLLDRVGPADHERIAYLEKALSNLQTGELSATDELLGTLADQLAKRYGAPPLPRPPVDRFKELR